MTAYYNEIDKFAAQWLRNLIASGHIAPGDVDDRSIEDVRPSDLDGYAQCHFFAGVGVWSYALRLAGWPDDRPVWSGSCPCQPFSEAGRGTGFADKRHLWPFFHHLISQRLPAEVLGEQVASKDANPWIDLVQDDMEALGYSFGAVPFPAAGVGAPHIRDRLYWGASRRDRRGMGAHGAAARLAHTAGEQHKRGAEGGRQGGGDVLGNGRGVGGLADAKQHHSGREAQTASDWESKADRSPNKHSGHSGAPVRLANATRERWPGHARPDGEISGGPESVGAGGGAAVWTGPVNGQWRDADWLFCRDGRWRPVEPSTFPLAHGSPARVGRLRAYGNAINAEAARVFIEAVMECAP